MANLSEKEVVEILKKYDIPTVKERLAKTKKEAVKASRKIGYPVVMKIVSNKILHKSESGGVVTDVRYDREAEEAFDKIITNAAKYLRLKEKKDSLPHGINGVIVQQKGKGYEVIIGGSVDPQFGPTLMFGLGGVWVEALQDVSFRVCPITKEDAEEMVEEIKGYIILKGFRGKPPGDLKALVKTLLACSKMMMEKKVKEFDINPLFVQPKGVLAVDFRMSK